MVLENFYSNPDAVVIAFGILTFVIVFYVINKFRRNAGVAFLIALPISIITAWYLYKNEFYLEENILFFLLIAIVTLIFLRILFAFFRFGRSRFR